MLPPVGVLNLVGTEVDRYEVGEQLGQGGFGAVFRARHRVIGNEVALKVLWPDHATDPKSVERFLQEARAAAAVGNDHIVRVFDAGTTPDGVVFLAMELLTGHTLERELRLRGKLPIAEAVAIVRDILDALVAAHARGIIHRDIKPANVMLAEDGEAAVRVKLLDFGISKIAGSKPLTVDGAILGTPQYMAPEQLEGSAGLDARADLYAVGTILYELISGSVPFAGAGYSVLVQRLGGERPRDLSEGAPHVPRALADVVMRCLAVDPDARFPTAQALIAALEAALAGRSVDLGSAAATLPPPPGASVRPGPSMSRTALLPETSPGISAPPERVVAIEPVAPRSALAWIGIGVLAVLLAGGLGVLGVLGYRVAKRPAHREPRVVAHNPLPVDVEPAPLSMIEPVAVPLPPPDEPDVPPSVAPLWEIVTLTGTG